MTRAVSKVASAPAVLSALFAPDPDAAKRSVEFFTANIRNHAVRRHPRGRANLYPPGVGAGAMAFQLSCRPGLARHLRRRKPIPCTLSRVGTVAAGNPKANLESPHHGPAQRWPAQLCIGPAGVLGDSRVASRRPRRIYKRSSSIIIIKMCRLPRSSALTCPFSNWLVAPNTAFEDGHHGRRYRAPFAARSARAAACPA
jgi:hypothetical protein